MSEALSPHFIRIEVQDVMKPFELHLDHVDHMFNIGHFIAVD